MFPVSCCAYSAPPTVTSASTTNAAVRPRLHLFVILSSSLLLVETNASHLIELDRHARQVPDPPASFPSSGPVPGSWFLHGFECEVLSERYSKRKRSDRQ